MTTKEAMDHLRAVLHSDPDYAWGWHCNIAMAAVDEGLDRDAANRAAARFMKNCFDVDTNQVNAAKNLGGESAGLKTEQGFDPKVSAQIERDTARGLWNKPSADDDGDGE